MDWSSIPTEAEMSAFDFGPKQIKLFLEKMAKDILPESQLAKSQVSIEEDGQMNVLGYNIFQSLGGWTLYTKSFGPSAYENPFELIENILCLEAKNMVIDWKLTNYACLA